MTNLMNILLIWVACLATCFSQTQPKEPNRYCSEKFNFCATYPAYALPDKVSLTKGEGILLKSVDGFAEVVIESFPADEEENTKSVFFDSVKKITPSENGPKIISSLFGEDFYECYFLIERLYCYHRCFLLDGHFVRVQIKVPINMPDKLQILQQQIHLDFNVSPEQEKTSFGPAIGSLKD